jgi:peptide/nickel transport system substrate-binding protein
LAQKAGGTLRISHRDNPPERLDPRGSDDLDQPAVHGVFNNLVFFDPREKVNSPDKIVPELAESWSYNADQTQLTMKLRQGVKWHDGKPFTSADVKCTWESLAGHTPRTRRLSARTRASSGTPTSRRSGPTASPRSPSCSGGPQPSFLSMLAGGYSPVYALPRARPRDALQADRHRAVQGGRLQRNESIKLVKNPGLLEEGPPHLDAIDWKIVPNRSTGCSASSRASST